MANEGIVKDIAPKGTFEDQQDVVVRFEEQWDGTISGIAVELRDASQGIAFTFDEAVALRHALKQALKAWTKRGVV